jgi:5-hydroxyisourate hydrolase-like protein (transthyretin family)
VPAGHDGTLVGYLSEVDGSPAAGRMMSVMSQSWERTGHFETSMVDEHGDWRIEKLPADTYQVYVVFDVQFGVVTRVGQVDVPDHGEAHFATQLPSGRLAGHVLSPDGTPLAGTDLVILERQAMGTWEFIAHIVADDAGAWACEALGPGLYRPMAFDRTGVLAAARGDPVLLGTGEVSGLNVQLTQGGTLTVRVAGADGAPMAGATVQLHDARGDSWEFVQFQLTGDDGTLRLPGVPAGIWDVQAETSAGGSGRTTVEVRAGEPARADLVLPR